MQPQEKSLEDVGTIVPAYAYRYLVCFEFVLLHEHMTVATGCNRREETTGHHLGSFLKRIQGTSTSSS